NLREVTDRREATMSTTERTPDRVEQLWADWREARRTGDTEAMKKVREKSHYLLEGMMKDVVLETKKAFFNVIGGAALQATKWAAGDEEDWLEDGQFGNGVAQILTAAPKSVFDHAYVGTDFLPETGFGQIPWRYTGELGHQAMRDNFDDSASELWEEEDFLEEAEEEG
ncbi:hypothetical protein, partial [Nocardiopsis kunsanensis]|uniref:hypothetical protein n=1 Tax=Nocardiopsis kunsanensis TaxID=141693 RepID=UPI001E62AC89